ncbi:MAG: hypothetical protein MI867_15825, partial [Pseudomonadales bacterium]|nr:hypothetical protein [Pseudomonadales bacterium]
SLIVDGLRTNAIREDSAVLAMKGLRQAYFWDVLEVEKAYLEEGVKSGGNRLRFLRLKVTGDLEKVIGMEYLPEGRAMDRRPGGGLARLVALEAGP